jgi:hypothetical protein
MNPFFDSTTTHTRLFGEDDSLKLTREEQERADHLRVYYEFMQRRDEIIRKENEASGIHMVIESFRKPTPEEEAEKAEHLRYYNEFMRNLSATVRKENEATVSSLKSRSTTNRATPATPEPRPMKPRWNSPR